MEQQHSGNRLIVKNASLLYVRMLFTMALGFYSSRIVLKALGVSDYGLFAIVGILIVVINLLVGALSSSTSRFITFSLGEDNLKRQKVVFSTSFIIHSIFAVVFLVLAESVGLWIVNNYLNIPEGREQAANWVYQASVFSTFLGITQTPYNASITAHEHLNVFAYIQIFESVAKLLIALVVLYSSCDHLILYSILYVTISIVVMAVYRLYCIRKFDECHVSMEFDKFLFKRMFVFSAWELIGSISFNLYSQGRNIFVNRFLGTTINAAVGVAGQVQSLLFLFLSNITTAFRPQIIKETASGNFQRAISLVEMGTKFTTLLAIISTVPFFFHIDCLMAIWLEEIPEGAIQICQIFLIGNFLYSFNPFVYTAIQATGKNKRINTNMSALYLLVLVLMYMVVKCTKSYLYFYICGLLVSVVSTILYISGLKRQMPLFSASRFCLRICFPISLLFSFCMFITWFLRYNVSSLLQSFLFSIVAVFGISLGFTYFLVFSKSERVIIKRTLSNIRGYLLLSKNNI